MVPNMEHCVDSIRAEDGEAACHVWEEGVYHKAWKSFHIVIVRCCPCLSTMYVFTDCAVYKSVTLIVVLLCSCHFVEINRSQDQSF